ncbi:MAG: ABC transporter ATP-binding protein [Thermotogae bacterium]|jgi:ABC-2 type transport system ATP-binding protein|nr:ABC transporter ATP-binding protein [Thermotogota bacterium]MCL5032302.1 ABC transporter ATP-binding protein [Thermotogota bacterium]
MEKAVEIHELTKIYDDKIKALDGISFVIPTGSIFAILGLNGAGKTTTLKSILGLIKPTSGKVTTLGDEPFPDGVKDASFVPEEKELYQWITVPKMIDIFSSFAPKFSVDKFKKIADKFELTMDRKIGELSQGNRTKLYISLAFSQDVSLYVLDEPTWGLDPVMRKHVLDTIKAFAINGKTIVYSSHILSEVEEVCDRMIILKSGKIVYDGTVDDLKDKTGNDLSGAFLNLMEDGEKK